MDPRWHTHSAGHLDKLIARGLSDDPQAVVRAIERDGLWEYVAARATSSQTAGALVRALGGRVFDVPRWTRRELEAYAEHLAAANAYRVACTERILARLQAENVPFLLLKGMALLATVYEDPGERAMADVDVLIRPADVERVDRLLKACRCSTGPDLVREDFYPRYYYEREYFTGDRPPVKIDLHVRPFRPLRYARTVPDDALWDRPTRVRFGKLLVAVPSPENMLIHLAAHAAGHGLAQLRWLDDMRRWLDRYGSQIDPGEVGAKCRQWKLTLPVRRALERTREVFGISSPVLSDLVRAVTQRASVGDWLALGQAPMDHERPVRAVLVNMLCTPGLRFRLGYLKAVLFPGRSHMGQVYRRRHPGWLIAAHLVRVLRGLSRPFVPAPPNPA